MTQQEMAEWLAENLFNGHRGSVDGIDGWFIEGEFNSDWNWLEYIDSPDGFFAVWDALNESNVRAYNVLIRAIDQMYLKVGGKDRYEAFYNAVYEAFKA